MLTHPDFNASEHIRILEKDRYEAREALRQALGALQLVLALNRMPIDRCPRKVGGMTPYVAGYPIDQFRVDLDPKALEQIKTATHRAVMELTKGTNQ